MMCGERRVHAAAERGAGGREAARRTPQRKRRCTLALAIAGLLARGLHSQTIGTFPTVAVPPENPLTPEKVLLGKALFFEEQLSSDNTMACATCHMPEAGGSDPNAGALEPGLDEIFETEDDEFGSPGMVLQNAAGDYEAHAFFGVERQATQRNAPSTIGAAFFESLFWDSRAESVFRDEQDNVVLSANAALESQAVAPLVSATEMAQEGRTWAELTAKLAGVKPLDLALDLPSDLAAFLEGVEDYGTLFELAFGEPGITREKIAMAIASYERTLVPDQTPFFLNETTAQEELGWQVFVEQGCDTCHPDTNGLFSDGLPSGINLPGHSRSVKSPTLLNVGLRPRFMSSGQFTTLGQVLDHYENIGLFNPNSSQERAALLVFMENALTDPRVAAREPPFDRPTLQSELGSNQYGSGTAGSGGFVPVLLSSAPSNLGNQDFKIGIGRGLGGATAVLMSSFRATPTAPPLRRSSLAGGWDSFGDFFAVRTLSGTQPGEGAATFRSPLPADPALLGVVCSVRWIVRDPAAGQGRALTASASYVLFSEHAERSSP